VTVPLAVVVAVAVGCVLGLALTPAVSVLLRRRGIVDVPNERSSHHTVAVRAVGIAPALALAAGTAIVLVAHPAHLDAGILLVVVVASLAFAVLGLLEDLLGLRIATRVVAQGVIGGTAAALLSAISGWSWMLVPVWALAVIVYVNFANFMDGVDGISGLHGLLAGVALTVAAVLDGQLWLTVVGLLLAVVFASFLPWNVRGGAFLGDVGSYLLGATIAIAIVAGILTGVPVVALAGIVVVYAFDAGVTLLTRMIKRERWYAPHRTHIYQRLTDHGLSHLGSALVVTGASAVCAAAGLVLGYATSGPPVVPIAVVVVVLAAYAASPWIAGRRAARRHPGGS
jgi:UDP-N-acetylmuramyl pentapeptide phosphotransferase/UDP-N-acetylglucosamine-1-phosphate transferase